MMNGFNGYKLISLEFIAFTWLGYTSDTMVQVAASNDSNQMIWIESLESKRFSSEINLHISDVHLQADTDRVERAWSF